VKLVHQHEHPKGDPTPVLQAIRDAIVAKMSDAEVEVTGRNGHYTIQVRSSEFAGKSMLESHRTVYSAIKSLMSGDDCPVHAVDALTTVAK